MSKIKELAPGITKCGKVISIDFTQWATQRNYAEMLGRPESTVRCWVAVKKIESVYIPELRMTLVRIA
jgi:hypothetical protein